ncbi:MAG: hypothetical protein U0234_24980 [Sandaracinus sp.]
MRTLCLAVSSLWLVLVPAVGLAQEGVASSGMDQGQAHITTHTGITLSLEPVGSTTAARVQAMGRAVQAQMATVRGCYHTVVARRPTVTGVLRMQIALAEGTGGPTITVTDDGVHDEEMLTCARNALSHIATADISRPAAVIAVLTLDNTAAEGTAVSAARAAAGEEVPVAHEGGRGVATSAEGDVRYVVRGAEGVADELVAEAYRVVGSQMAGMRDCRRHSARRGRSPRGVIHFDVTMTAGQPLVAHARDSTVAAPDAGTCIEQRLARAPRTPASGPATVEVEVTFAP